MPPPSILGTGLAGILAGTGSQKGLNLQGQAGKGILECWDIKHWDIKPWDGMLLPGKGRTELEQSLG